MSLGLADADKLAKMAGLNRWKMVLVINRVRVCQWPRLDHIGAYLPKSKFKTSLPKMRKIYKLSKIL